MVRGHLSGRFAIALHSYLRFLDMGEVIGVLHAEPGLGIAAEGLGKPHCHLRRNTGLFIDYVVQGLPRDAKHAGAICDTEAKGFETLVPNDPPGVGRVFHWARYFINKHTDSSELVQW